MDKLPDRKKCCDCKEEKLLDDFKKNGKMKDGRLNRCRVCEKEVATQRKEQKAEYAKKYFTF